MSFVLSLNPDVGPSNFVCDVEHTSFHFGLCGRKFVLCLFGQCPGLCTICHSWQHTGVAHLSLQADGKVAFEDIPVFGVCRPACHDSSLYLFVLVLFIEAVVLSQEQGIEDVYIEILKYLLYTDSSVTVHLHKESEKIRIKRGVRQGDTISPKLFTATLESIFRRLNWENKGVKIDGEFLPHLRSADDIFLCTETAQELQQMLHELSDESRRMGLKMNITKTKVMVVDNTPINVNNVLIENVPGYVNLGHIHDRVVNRALSSTITMIISQCPHRVTIRQDKSMVSYVINTR